MKRLQVHSTAQLRAAPQTDSIPPAVTPPALTSNSAAFPAFLIAALSPTSLRSGSFLPNSTSSPAASFPRAASESKLRSPSRIHAAINTGESEMPHAASPSRIDDPSAGQHDAPENAADGLAVPHPVLDDTASNAANVGHPQDGDVASADGAAPGARAQAGNRMKHEDAMEFLERVRSPHLSSMYIFNILSRYAKASPTAPSYATVSFLL